MSSVAPLCLQLLGGSQAVSSPDETPASFLGVGKPLALLTYLACSPRRAETREHLTDLLWSDVEPDAARHALRQTLWYIKRRLADGILTTEGDRIALAVPVQFDRDDFLAAVQRLDWQTAANLYRGDFFVGFAAPGGAEFERWADVERQHLRSLYLRCLEQLAGAELAAAHFREAQSWARKLRDAEPMRQASWRTLLETLIAGRDSLGAALEADAVQRMLAAESIEPEPATRRLIRLAGQNRTPADAHSAAPLLAELIGREQEFSTLLRLWEDTRDGAGRAVSIIAPAGIGKTRLLLDFDARLRAARARCIYVRASAAARDIPYAFAGDLAAALADCPGARAIHGGVIGSLLAINPSLSSLFPDTAPDTTTGDEAMRRRLVALRELAVAVAEEQPIALLMDDLHWCDAASLQLLGAVRSGVEHRRVLMVGASRAATSAIQSDVTTLTLAPLQREQVARLLSSIGTLPQDEWVDVLVDGLHRASGGSPLLLMESLQLCCEREALVIRDGVWTLLDSGGLAALLVDGAALRRRLEPVTTDDRNLLLLLALAAQPMTTVLIGNSLGDAHGIEERLRALEERGLVSAAPNGWRIVHDEYAALIVREASSDECRDAHLAVAAALLGAAETDSRSEARAASHLAAAGDYSMLAPVLVRRVALARRSGDPRNTSALVRALVGDRVSDADVQRLASRVPWHVRAGLVTPTRVGAAAAACIVAISLFGLGMRSLTSAERTDARPALVIGMPDEANGTLDLFTVPIAELSLTSGAETVGDRFRKSTIPTLTRGAFMNGAPTEQGWIVSEGQPRTATDSGGIELFEITLDGTRRRLTFVGADDHSPVLSPDGRRILFATGRYTTDTGHDELAIMNRDGSNVRRLTTNAGIDNGARWHPDGSRIAFIRREYDKPFEKLCTMGSDGTGEACRELGERGIANAGWIDSSNVLLLMPGRRLPRLVLFDVDNGTPDDTRVESAETFVSPDGRWLLCQCRRAGFQGGEWWVAPTHDLSDMRLLPHTTLNTPAQFIGWRPGTLAPHYVDSLNIVMPNVPIAKQTTYALETEAFDALGRHTVASDVRWRSGNTSIATVDSLGVVRAIGIGTVQVIATAGGWRSATRTLTITSPITPTVLLDERWTPGWERRWVRFGEPKPVTRTIGSSSWLLPNGDGSYNSGVILDSMFDAHAGLTIETVLSVPIVAQQWQAVRVGFEAYKEPNVLPALATSGNVQPNIYPAVSCGFGFPGDFEGYGYGTHAAVSVTGPAGEQVLVAADASWRTGRTFALAVQLLPDGRCQVRVNGTVIHTSRARANHTRRFHATIYAQSDRTTIAVGPVKIVTGAYSASPP